MAIVINGIRIEGNLHNVRVNGNTVIVNGDVIGTDFKNPLEVRVLEGAVANIEADGSVHAGEVTGNVSAGGSVHAEDIGGNVSAGGSVKANDIAGNVSAGGSIKLR